MDLPAWQEHDKRIDSEQIPDARALLDRLPVEFLESLSPLEALSLAYEPAAYLRARQQIPSDGDWLTTVFMTGRGWGKSHAAAGWIIGLIVEAKPGKPTDIALVAPTIDDCWNLQWRVIQALVPPWVRYVERVARGQILFPDHGVTLFLHSAENTQYRGPNLRAAWAEEPVKWSRGAELWTNMRLALRVRGETPPRAVMTTTPPDELGWLLELCAEPTTRVVRGTMRDNPALDDRAVEALYTSMAGSIAGARELDGRVVLGTDGALFKLEDLEAARVQAAPALSQIVIAVDPAQSAKRDADPVGIVALGIAQGGLYVLASCSERLAPAEWADRAIGWAERYHAGRFIVEPTGSGGYPRATLEAQQRLLQVPRRPILESPARGSKADRAAPLSAAAAQGRLHLVGRHEQLERELTTWHPGAGFSPGGLDALVHGASWLTNNWTARL
ncbi:MAG TPA: terminase family protein [Polyangiaceae bacterium]|nr:terminase family protein [Polyangiaceae bacterium]